MHYLIVHIARPKRPLNEAACIDSRPSVRFSGSTYLAVVKKWAAAVGILGEHNRQLISRFSRAPHALSNNGRLVMASLGCVGSAQRRNSLHALYTIALKRATRALMG